MRLSMKRNFLKKSIARGLSVASVIVATSVGAQADNLADALVGAYNTSGLLEQNRALLRAADEDVALATATLRPVLNFIMSAQRNDTNAGSNIVPRTFSRRDTLTAQISATWLLYDSGGRQMSRAAAKETVLATRQQLLSVEQSVLLRAVSAYVNILLQGENVELRQNNLRLLQEELRAAQDRFDVGEVTRTDVALAESQVAAARSNLSTAQGGLVSARAEYLSAVGSEPGTLAGQPRMPAIPASIEQAQAVAMRTHPDILAAQHQVAAAELAIKAAQSDLGPSVSAGADFSYSDDLGSSSYSEDTSLSLTLNQPIYRGGSLLASVRRAMATRDASRGNLLNVQRQVLLSVNDAFVRLRVARANLSATAEQVRAAQVAFDGIREEATLGARTTLDVLSAEQELLDAATARISARSEESVAAYQLLAAQGLLTAERMQLGVQIYDPTLYYNLAKDAPSTLSKQSKDLDRVLKALGRK